MNPRIFRQRRFCSISTAAVALLSSTALSPVRTLAQAGSKATHSTAKASDDSDVVSVLMQAEAGRAGVGGPPPAWYDQFQEAVKNAQSGKHLLAEKQFIAILKTQPHIGAVWANLGISEAERNHFPEAIVHLNRAVAETTDKTQQATFQLQLAGVYGRSSLWKDSATAAQKALVIAPAGSRTAISANTYYALALMHLNQYQAALDILKSRPTLPGEKPIVADLRYIIAEEQTGRVEQAFADSKDLLHRYPKEPAAINSVIGVGDAAVHFGRLDIALTAFQTAFAAKPDDVALGLNVVTATVRVQAESNDPELHAQMDKIAMGTLTSLLHRYPQNAKLHFEYGALLFASPTPDQNKLLSAERHLRYASVLEPTNVVYLTQAALCVVLQGPDRLKEAIPLLQGAISLDPKYPMARLGMGYAHEQETQTDKPNATQHFNEALQQYQVVIGLNHRDDSDFKARNRVAGILYTLKQKDAAYKAWQAIIDRYPDTYGIDVAAETASRMIEDKKYSDAERLYSGIVARRPKDATAYVGLGQAEELLGKYPVAEQDYQKALAIQPTNATAALALGNLLNKHLDRPQDAVAVYETMLKAAASPAGLKDAAMQDSANKIRLQLGSDYAIANKDDDALRIYRTLTIRKDDPNRTMYQLTAGRFLISRKRYAEAEKDLTEMYAENPTEREIGYELARAQELNGNVPGAFATLRAIADKAKAEPDERTRALIQVAALSVRQNQLEDGAKEYEDVLRVDPTQKIALDGLSGARQKQGHSEMAGTFLETLALAGDKTPNMELVRDIYYIYVTQNQTPDRYRAALVKMADHYLESRAAQVLALNALLDVTAVNTPANRVTAAPIVERMLAVNAKDPDALYWRGLIRENDGKKADAIADYTAAVQANYGNGPAIAALKRLGAPVPLPPVAPVTPATPPAAPGTGNQPAKPALH